MPSDTLDNGVREDVFNALIDAQGPLTPSAIADEIGTDRELVSYHLGILLDAGLVLREGEGKYYPQPLLTDPEFENEVDEAIRELVKAGEQQVFVDPEAEASPEMAVLNAVRARVVLSLFGDGGDDDTRQ